MRPGSRRHSRRGLVGASTLRSTPISRSPLGKNPMPGHLSELHPVNEVNTKGTYVGDRLAGVMGNHHFLGATLLLPCMAQMLGPFPRCSAIIRPASAGSRCAMTAAMYSQDSPCNP